MRRAFFRVVVVWLALVSAGVAQTTVRRLSWDQPGVSTVAEAQALVYRLQVDTAAAATVPQTCTLAGSVVSCSTPLPAMTPGPHTLVLSVDNGFGSASAMLSGSSPVSPINLSITVTVVVTGP